LFSLTLTATIGPNSIDGRPGWAAGCCFRWAEIVR
jgi:hypothetical protein